MQVGHFEQDRERCGLPAFPSMRKLGAQPAEKRDKFIVKQRKGTWVCSKLSKMHI